MIKVLVLGASGATGLLVVQMLLQKGVDVVAIVRSRESLLSMECAQSTLQIVETEISEISEDELAEYLAECEVVVSCLGHNVTFKGMFGHPRRLVTEVIKKVASTIESKYGHIKYKIILMNTTGNSNDDISEKPPLSQRFVVFFLRILLPPHVDNEEAAGFLRTQVGRNNNNIEWVAVRPDSLINEDQVSIYDIYESPIRNAIFNAGKSSRINVADFMSNLVVKPELWNEWKGKMPVIYNRT